MLFVNTSCRGQWPNPCFAHLPFQDSEPPAQRPCFISADLAATVCFQSLPCENDKLKWYMCGLTCTAQESRVNNSSLFVNWIYSPSWGESRCRSSVGPLGGHYRPPTNPHGLQLPISLQEWLQCHLLLASCCMSFCRCGFFFIVVIANFNVGVSKKIPHSFSMVASLM